MKKIAVVDDHHDLLEIATMRLTKYGYHVTTFADPRLFLDAVLEQGFAPDALLLDVAMPQLSGFDVLRILEERGAKPPTVIVMTAISDQDVHLESFLKGATAVIEKPADWLHVRKLLETALGLA